MNLPNSLSFIRIIIALVAPFYLIGGNLTESIVVGVICTIAIATDYFDGWYARKYNKITKLGKILDPIADKALVLISFSVLAYLIDELSFWWIIPIFIREILVTIYRFLFLSKNIVVAAAKSGKIKTVLQMLTIGIAYFFFMTRKYFLDKLEQNFGLESTQSFMYIFSIIMFIALALTLYYTIKSGYLFFKNNWQTIKRFHQLA